MPNKVRIGLFGIGLDPYWPQFNGLLDRLTGYHKQIAERLRGNGVQLIYAGLVDNPQKAHGSAQAFLHEWSRSGPAHHCAIGVGHIADQLEKLGALLGVEVKRV